VPFNGFLGPSSKQAVLTRILRHPDKLLFEFLLYYKFSGYANIAPTNIPKAAPAKT
jgi:hypothetical protein